MLLSCREAWRLCDSLQTYFCFGACKMDPTETLQVGFLHCIKKNHHFRSRVSVLAVKKWTRWYLIFTDWSFPSIGQHWQLFLRLDAAGRHWFDREQRRLRDLQAHPGTDTTSWHWWVLGPGTPSMLCSARDGPAMKVPIWILARLVHATVSAAKWQGDSWRTDLLWHSQPRIRLVSREATNYACIVRRLLPGLG